MQKYYDCGIDLGTTNSCIAVPDDNNGYLLIENQMDATLVTPSAVSVFLRGSRIAKHIGIKAYNTELVDDLAITFKRKMGTSEKLFFLSTKQSMSP